MGKRAHSRVHRLWALVAAPLLVTSVSLPAVAASGGNNAPPSSFVASISTQETPNNPATVPGTAAQAPAGQSGNFVVDVHNDSSSGNSIGSVQIVVPTGFIVDSKNVVAPTGWVVTPTSCSTDSPVGCSTGTLVQVNTPNNGAQKLAPGTDLTFSIPATAPNTWPGGNTNWTGPVSQWTIAAKTSSAWSNGQVVSLDTYNGSPVYPTVKLYQPPTHFVVSAPVDEQNNGVVSQTTQTQTRPFDVTITAEDDQRNPAPYHGSVELTAADGQTSATDTSCPPPTGQTSPLTGTTTYTFTGQSTYTFTGLTYPCFGQVTLTLSSTLPSNSPLTFTVAQYASNASVSETDTNVSVSASPSCTATAAAPLCTQLLLPNGANNSASNGKSPVQLSVGTCVSGNSVGSSNCPTESAPVANATVDLGFNVPGTTTPAYSLTNPATMILDCDQSVCGTGSIQTPTIYFEGTVETTFSALSACPSKGTVAKGTTACVDYVQTHRDKAGDLIAYVLFTSDAAFSFG